MTCAAIRAGAPFCWWWLALCAVLPLTVGCRTQQTTEFNRTHVVGAIYDDVGRPISGAHIEISQRQAVSDTLGRFRVNRLPPGNHSLVVTADAHEPHRTAVEIQSRTQFIRVQLYSIITLVDQAITYAEASAMGAAEEVARRLEAAAPDDRRTILLRRLVSDRQELHEEGTP